MKPVISVLSTFGSSLGVAGDNWNLLHLVCAADPSFPNLLFQLLRVRFYPSVKGRGFTTMPVTVASRPAVAVDPKQFRFIGTY